MKTPTNLNLTGGKQKPCANFFPISTHSDDNVITTDGPIKIAVIQMLR